MVNAMYRIIPHELPEHTEAERQRVAALEFAQKGEYAVAMNSLDVARNCYGNPDKPEDLGIGWNGFNPDTLHMASVLQATGAVEARAALDPQHCTDIDIRSNGLSDALIALEWAQEFSTPYVADDPRATFSAASRDVIIGSTPNPIRRLLNKRTIGKNHRREAMGLHADTVHLLGCVSLAKETLSGDLVTFPERNFMSAARFGQAHDKYKGIGEGLKAAHNALYAMSGERAKGRVLHMAPWVGRFAMGWLHGLKNPVQAVRFTGEVVSMIPNIASRKKARAAAINHRRF
jgi:hypothetical protein